MRVKIPLGWLVMMGWLGIVGTSRLSAKEPEPVVLRGKVVTLDSAVKALSLGLTIDTEAARKQVVLLEGNGTVVPLIQDDASRALFLDERLRDRPAELGGRRFAAFPYFQVVTVKIQDDARYRTPEYYCNICTISVRFPQTCPCCQGPMELRMKPDRP